MSRGRALGEWELVHESVDFMTAIKALDRGKRIRVEWGIIVRTYEGYLLQDNNRHQPVTTDEIIRGEWYIEEEIK